MNYRKFYRKKFLAAVIDKSHSSLSKTNLDILVATFSAAAKISSFTHKVYLCPDNQILCKFIFIESIEITCQEEFCIFIEFKQNFHQRIFGNFFSNLSSFNESCTHLNRFMQRSFIYVKYLRKPGVVTLIAPVC